MRLRATTKLSASTRRAVSTVSVNTASGDTDSIAIVRHFTVASSHCTHAYSCQLNDVARPIVRFQA